MRVVTSEIAPVTGGEAARPVCPDRVLMVLQYFDNFAGLVPFGWVSACLVLDQYGVSAFQWC